MLYCHLYCNSKSYFSSERSIERISHRRFLYKKGVLTNFSKLTRKHLYPSVFFKRLYYRFFPVNFPKFVRPLFIQNTIGRLLLYLEPCQISMIDLQRKCFAVKLVKFLKTPFSTLHLGSCLLRHASNSNNNLFNIF